MVCKESKLQVVHDDLTCHTLICRVNTKEHERGREAETMRWPNSDEETAVWTVILSKDTEAKREAIRWERGREAKVGGGVWMGLAEGLRSDGGRVGAATVCKHGDSWKAFRSHLGTGRMVVYDAELCAIGLALRESVWERDTLQTQRVTKVAVINHPQRAIQGMEHLEPWPG